jgi:glycosyltransferase involved in cell wall biosynthesis
MTTASKETWATAAAGRTRHLAIFVRSLEGGGGAERMMVSLARAFSERGHRVDLVLGTARGGFLEDVPASVRIVELGKHHALRALPMVLKDRQHRRKLAPAFLSVAPHWVLGCIPDLVRYLERERPDAMLSALNYSNLAALWACHLAQAPTRLVVSERNVITHRSRVSHRNFGLPRLTRDFYPWADGISAVSDGVAEDLANVTGIPRERITTTGNPVVGPEIARLAAAPLDDPWFHDPAVPVVLAAGKLKPQKGFDVLLDAFARLREGRAARLVILGQGELRRTLEQRAGELSLAGDVAFPGFVENPFRYMAHASLFVLSSRWEGLPGVLIQAMACGCPVVSTDCPSGPREILEGGLHGELVPVDDAEALAAAMARRLAAPRDAQRLTERASVYSVERSVDRYLALLIPDAA